MPGQIRNVKALFNVKEKIDVIDILIGHLFLALSRESRLQCDNPGKSEVKSPHPHSNESS